MTNETELPFWGVLLVIIGTPALLGAFFGCLFASMFGGSLPLSIFVFALAGAFCGIVGLVTITSLTQQETKNHINGE